MRFHQLLLRVWIDKGGKDVDKRADESERRLKNIEKRTKKLEQMLDVKGRPSPDRREQS
jgi:hypothetical protein